ncbi:MAG: MFS transporter [Myxacorys chilensis ATA2-1-KO14]|jgi:multidrug resistance protein|nr:MFS transporter [Myxacorys chilensis ATA2-1-KO14]
MPHTKFRRKISPLLFIFITILLDKLGESILFPILPFLLERFRTDAMTLGLLTASFALAQFFATPIIGSLSDRYGRRPVLLICVLGTSLSYYMFGLAGSLWVLFVSRMIDGVTGGVAATAQAYIADISTPADRAKNFGLTGAAFGLGFVLGPALGGSLAGININLPVFFAGTVALLNFILGWVSLPESLTPENRRVSGWKDLNPFSQISDLFQHDRIKGFLWTTFIFNFAFSGFSSIFVLFLNRRFGWGPSSAALVFVFIGVLSTLIQGGLIRKLIPAFGEGKLTLAGLVALALGLGLIVVIPSDSPTIYVLLYLSQGLLALGVGLILPCLRGLISNRVSAQEQGRTLGSAQGLQSIASILGPLWASWCFDQFGMLSPFWLGSLFILLAFGTTWMNLRSMSPQAAA